jgi:hypothetical protein
MQHHSNEQFFSLLRYALGAASSFDARPTEAEWRYIYEQGVRQSVIALLFTAVNRLRDEQEPPLELTMKWATEAEDVRALNALLNSESKRLTDLFEAEGYHTAILKGQANARLYPDPMSRQPGDIDIFVDGGMERVAALLTRLGLIEEGEKPQGHHWHLPEGFSEVIVEVHHRPLPRTDSDTRHTDRIMAYLQEEFERATTLCPEGFKVPSIAYALVMQLSHMRRHAMNGGIGLRQVIDYYVLLNHATDAELQQLRIQVKHFGMKDFAAALMWILQQTLHLPANKMIAKPNRFRGQWLLRFIMEGGNFGFYKPKEETDNMVRVVWNGRIKAFNTMLIWPETARSIWRDERKFLSYLICSIPRRIRQRTLFFSKVPKQSE